MLVCSRCKDFKETKEFYKDSSKNRGFNYWCKECRKKHGRSEKGRTCQKRYDFKRDATEHRKNYRKQQDKQYRENNLEKTKNKDKKYSQNNPDKIRAKRAKRHTAKLQRTPKWLTKNDWIEINWAYQIAAQKTKETGILYEVDHIIPLQGKNISGLHCPQNLQILTKSKNASKRNVFLC